MIRKWKRGLALALALSMIVAMVPADEVRAAYDTNETEDVTEMMEDETIRFYFTYGRGAKRLASAWDEDSVYKDGSSWYESDWTLA